MLRAIPRALFGTQPVEIYSPLPVAESIVRLKNATDSSLLGPLAGQSMTGSVSEERIRLERSISFVHNSFKPVLVGKIEAHSRGSVLRGTFGLPWTVRAFMSFWFGFCILWTIAAAVSVATTPEAWYFPLAGVAMMVAGYGIVRLCQWFARNDRRYLEHVIKAALAQRAA
jgi:hypothetical protein